MAQYIVKTNSEPMQYITKEMCWTTNIKKAWSTNNKAVANNALVTVLFRNGGLSSFAHVLIKND